jgi:drug/metabolite transporter (DMT)-like permease
MPRHALVSRSIPPPLQPGASSVAIWSALISVYLIWGSTYLAIRFAVETVPPFLMAAARFLISGGLLYAWRRRLARDNKPTWTEWRNAAIIGIFLLVGGNGGVVWAEQFIASSLAALMVATVPLWMVTLEVFLGGKKKPNAYAITGILIGFIGVVILIRSAASDTVAFDRFGVAALLLASLSWAIGSLYGRTANLPSSQLLGTAMEMSAGGLVLLVIATVLGEWRQLDLAMVSRTSALALVYLTFIGSAAFVAYVWLLRVAPTALVSTYAYVNPLVAVLLGYLVAGEAVTARTLISAALIIGSVALVSKK